MIGISSLQSVRPLWSIRNMMGRPGNPAETALIVAIPVAWMESSSSMKTRRLPLACLIAEFLCGLPQLKKGPSSQYLTALDLNESAISFARGRGPSPTKRTSSPSPSWGRRRPSMSARLSRPSVGVMTETVTMGRSTPVPVPDRLDDLRAGLVVDPPSDRDRDLLPAELVRAREVPPEGLEGRVDVIPDVDLRYHDVPALHPALERFPVVDPDRVEPVAGKPVLLVAQPLHPAEAFQFAVIERRVRAMAIEDPLHVLQLLEADRRMHVVRVVLESGGFQVLFASKIDAGSVAIDPVPAEEPCRTVRVHGRADEETALY